MSMHSAHFSREMCKYVVFKEILWSISGYFLWLMFIKTPLAALDDIAKFAKQTPPKKFLKVSEFTYWLVLRTWGGGS